MIKAGLFGLVAVLPLGTEAMPVLGAALGAAGLVSIVLAGLVGVTQTNPKAVLAYSSVGQMGLIALALGAGLAAPEIWPVLAPALVFYAAHHGFSKAALFLGVGACGAAAHRWRSAMLAILVVPAAGLAALPLTTGYAAKSALERGFGLAAEGWVPHLAAAVAVGSVATALLMMRFFIVLARQEGRAGSPALALPWLGAVGLAAAAGLLWPFGAPPRATLSAEGVVTGLLPLGVAAALAATAALLLGLLRLKVREVPPGETLALFERVTAPRRRPATIAALLPRWPALPAIRLRQPAGWGAGALATAAVLLAMALTEAPRAIAFPG
jgi:formate hydrogenlyase subunit 3/multisubunit Na+/H+ antiporter MnhD subunit